MGNADRMGETINLLEPFIAVANSDFLLLIIPAVFLTLISDFPRTDGNTMYLVQRTGKLNWLLGQLTFSLISIFSYILVIFIGTTIPVIGKSNWENSWSLVVRQYSVKFPEDSHSFASQLITSKLYNQTTPVSTLVKTIVLLFCYLLLIAMIMLFFNILKKKLVGIFCSVEIIEMGFSLVFLK